MQLVDGQVLVSASDLTGFLACEHLTHQERAASRGELSRPERVDPELDILTRRGQEHELAYLDQLTASGRGVVRLDVLTAELNRRTLEGLVAAHQLTVEAMRQGADVIYQAALFDGRWIGYADFLIRCDRPSALGAFSYEVADTKLARRVKAAALLQMCSYAEQVERIQGISPERLHVIVGDRTDQSYRLADFAAYYRAVKARFEDSVADGFGETYPTPVEHCKVCRWLAVCDARRRSDDHLSFVAGLGGAQVKKLAAVEIRTLAALATSTVKRVPKIGEATLERLRRQAALQLVQRETSVVSSELLTPELGRGLALLPPPSPGDLFFDMESDPWAEDGGLEYLFGVVEVTAERPRFRAFWGLDRAGEKKAFEDFIDFVMARRALDWNLHVYHYAGYEVTALKRLMGRHATREDEVDSLLRDGVLVDLYQVVRQGVRVSQESYSIKKLEPLYMGGREAEIKGGLASIVAFEEWLETRDQVVLDAIGEYNREDCESTWRLRDWLEQQRLKAAAQFGEPIGRPGPLPSEVPVERAADDEQTAQLVGALTAGLPEDLTSRSPEQHAQWLLSELLRWHRRDAKPGWWDYYHRFTLSDDELVDDAESIGRIEPTGEMVDVKRSSVKTYRFDPTQEHKLSPGKEVFDPRTRKYAGSLEYLDSPKGVLKLRKGRDESPTPTSIVPGGPMNMDVARDAVRRVASWVIEHGIDGPGPYRAARDLLLARPPRIEGLAAGQPIAAINEDGPDEARRVVSLLRETVLPIQGPPGSGKTYAGARMIVDLLRAGKTVAVTAQSHKAISNLLNAVCERADAEELTFKGVQRAPSDDCCDSPRISIAAQNDEVVEALDHGARLAAGTGFLFAWPEMAELFDVLFVDEAGQLSLANVVAIAGCARSVVLLGDPNQLAQPSQGTHPPGVGVSALEHLLGAHQTIPPDRGIFLGVTHRLHPDICAFTSEVFYEDRLVSDPSSAMQRIEGGGAALAGTGLRYLPVSHTGNRNTSPEEIGVVDREYRALLGQTWIDRDSARRPITQDDILVVAPYNVHVNRLRERLPAGARVGTVDRFQGQEAAVAFLSMATSGVDDMPRNMEFLYSLNRLNVAISRGLALAVLVCSPALLAVRCRNPEQMRLVNALCRLAELAGQGPVKVAPNATESHLISLSH